MMGGSSLWSHKLFLLQVPLMVFHHHNRKLTQKAGSVLLNTTEKMHESVTLVLVSFCQFESNLDIPGKGDSQSTDQHH